MTMSSEPQTTDYSTYPMSSIAKPHDNDILLGRGGVTHYHPGNYMYRQIVNTNKPLYASLKKVLKTDLSKSIVAGIRTQDPPGRFLQFDKVSSLWNDVGDKKAVEKTSQALREGQPTTKEKMNAAPSMAPADIPASSAGFFDMIVKQRETISLQQNKTPAHMMPHESPELGLERGLDRMRGSLILNNAEQTPAIGRQHMTKLASMTSTSDVSMFSNTPSTRELFAQISKQNLSLGLADWSSQMGSLDSDQLDEDMKSKMTIDTSDVKVGVDNFREHFRENRGLMSDLTCSMSKMEVSNRNTIFKDSDRSLESNLSMTSAFKNYLSENTISEVDFDSIKE